MVKVYVWFPTEAYNINLTRESNPSGINNARKFSRTVGHAALHLENDETGDDIYFSLYPDHPKEMEIILSPKTPFEAKFSTDYCIDEEEMGSTPDKIIYLKNLDEERIGKYVDVVNKRYSKYILFDKNCSTLVLDLLKQGSNNLSPSLFSKTGHMLSNLGKTIEPFVFFLEIMSMNNQPINQHMATLGMLSKFKPLEALNNLAEICGTNQPIMAFNYAKFLQEETGGYETKY
jgi:hypothetical protein